MPVVGQLKNPRNVLVSLSNKEDFVSVMSWGIAEMECVPHRIFHWTPEFNEDEDSPTVHVWISLSGLPPNYFHEYYSKKYWKRVWSFFET